MIANYSPNGSNLKLGLIKNVSNSCVNTVGQRNQRCDDRSPLTGCLSSSPNRSIWTQPKSNCVHCEPHTQPKEAELIQRYINYVFALKADDYLWLCRRLTVVQTPPSAEKTLLSSVVATNRQLIAKHWQTYHCLKWSEVSCLPLHSLVCWTLFCIHSENWILINANL